MSLKSGGTGYITNLAPPYMSYPMSVGCWAFNNGSVTAMLWSLGASGTARNSWNLGMVSGVWAINIDNGTQFESVSSTSAVAGQFKGVWVFLLAVLISTTSRKLYVYDGAGAGQLVSGTVSVPIVAGFDNMRLMARADATSQVWNGNVAEWWYTDSNVLASFGSGNIAGLTQLATRGPFAFPHIAQNIIEYRSLRTLPNLPANTRIGTEYYSSKYVTPTWTVGSATNLAYNAHPSLPSNYQQFKPRVASPLFSYAAQPGVASGGVGTAYVSGMAGMGRLMTS